jgi:flagellar hook-length control protein FliK
VHEEPPSAEPSAEEPALEAAPVHVDDPAATPAPAPPARELEPRAASAAATSARNAAGAEATSVARGAAAPAATASSSPATRAAASAVPGTFATATAASATAPRPGTSATAPAGALGVVAPRNAATLAPGLRATAAAADRADVKSAAPGYRTLHLPTLRAAEEARDSIFRQVALRMTDTGGELRVLLDPPELGKLDMHLVVEDGARLRLAVQAERPEVALLLQKHGAELRAQLEEQGFTITGVDVRTGDPRESAEREPRAHRDGITDAAAVDGELDAEPAVVSAGWITADGLDFWV